jgi:phosphoglycerate kinase
MAKLFIEDLELAGKKVITRVDFNVPLKDGIVESDKRLVSSIPTIKYLKEAGAKVILMSHLGRPKGKVVADLSLAPVAKRLGELLGSEVKFVSACVGLEAETAVDSLAAGDVLVLENLRFHQEETANDEVFAKQLASLADVYVNDAFGTAHRAHASTAGITAHISQSACGYLIKKELDFLGGALDIPKRPFVSIIGGAKISGKIDVVEALLPKVDKILIGGGMAYTFFKAQGLEIGKSLCEDDRVNMAKELIEKAGDKLVLPLDCIVCDPADLDFGGRVINGETKIVDFDKIPADMEACDIGPKTSELFANIVKNGKTIVWNGPMGIFEIEKAAKGTFAVADALVESTILGGITIIGGGDSAAAIEQAGLEEKVSHVSTGGGASLEFLEGKALPGVEALNEK